MPVVVDDSLFVEMNHRDRTLLEMSANLSDWNVTKVFLLQ